MKRLDRLLLVGALAVIVATPTLVAASRESVAAAEPTDAEKLAILWADYCERTEDPVCVTAPTPTATPTPSSPPTATVAPTPAPTAVPSASAAPSATPSPTPSATPTPTPSPTPTPTSAPTTTPPPTPPTDGFIGPEVAGLPTSGSAWNAVLAAANASPGTPNITCDQNQRAHPGAALASGLVYARTGDAAFRTRTISLIEAARATARDCGNAILSLGRQLGAYILAADYVGYRDVGFVAWVRAVRDQNFPGSHGRWKVLSATAGNTSNNWGTFALASLTAADAYLRDAAGLARDWAIYKGYGDASWTFQPTSSYQDEWNCTTYFAIEPGDCLANGKSQNGAPVEDASRSTYPTPNSGYVNEAVQGYALQALLLDKAGYDAFVVNDAQFCRVGAFQQRFGIANGHSTGHYYSWVHRDRCAGSTYPLATAPFGRVFGFTDYLLAN